MGSKAAHGFASGDDLGEPSRGDLDEPWLQFTGGDQELYQATLVPAKLVLDVAWAISSLDGEVAIPTVPATQVATDLFEVAGEIAPLDDGLLADGAVAERQISILFGFSEEDLGELRNGLSRLLGQLGDEERSTRFDEIVRRLLAGS